jgi:hypothetical protein
MSALLDAMVQLIGFALALVTWLAIGALAGASAWVLARLAYDIFKPVRR